MSAFEFYFSFFGLILGIAVANVAIGFGRLWRARGQVRVGACLPLLGVWLLCHAVLNWSSAWHSLQAVPVSPTSLFIGLFVSLPYVLVSTVMFPEDAERAGSLDDFYLSHSRLVMGAMMVPTLVGMIGYVALFGRHYSPASLVETFLVVFLVPLVLFFWRNLWAHRIGLALSALLVVWWMYR
ncbi:MAG: hypothetical protein B7Z12_02550 [Caulobacter vibrioides]|uniref:Uncharacterized protein n=1 Tax=Caulobacter vibrioides TaxID=155892 RepID=A0A258DDC4_CAUVI|nr:MAG: hypothetical protein B7Z12_02550 [Caulobacter vibrioides]